MSSEIPNVNTQAPQRPVYTDQAAENAKANGTSAKATDLARQVASLLGGRGVTVTASAAPAKETGTPAGATGAPALDNPDDAKALAANLEKLIAYLQLDNDERQAEMARDRIETNKASYQTEHAARKEKIQESLDKIADAEKSRKASKVFGWLMAALAVVVAVVACIATGGIAVGAVVGALVAVGLQLANELGAMDKLTEGIAELFEKAGMSKEAAKIAAAVFVTVAIIAASVACGAGANALATKLGVAGKALFATSEAVKATAECAKEILSNISRFVQIGSVVAGGTGAYLGYRAGMSQAEATETEKFMAALKQRMEESQEELEAILQAIQNAISQIADMLSSATDTSDEIARNIGQMA
jgi:hypothetical protein